MYDNILSPKHHPMHNFSYALIMLKVGEKVYRHSWGGLCYISYDKQKKLITLHGAERSTEWNPTQEDVLGDDWASEWNRH